MNACKGAIFFLLLVALAPHRAFAIELADVPAAEPQAIARIRTQRCVGVPSPRFAVHRPGPRSERPRAGYDVTILPDEGAPIVQKVKATGLTNRYEMRLPKKHISLVLKYAVAK